MNTDAQFLVLSQWNVQIHICKEKSLWGLPLYNPVVEN